MRHRLLLTLGILILSAVLAGCGGSTNTTATATTAAPTRAASAPAAASSPIATTVSAASVPAATVPVGSAAATRPAGSAPAPTVAQPTGTIPLATSASTVAVATASAASAATGGNAVTVDLKDFAIALNTSTVSAGMVTFTIRNNGPSPHNFNVQITGEEKGIPTLDPGKSATLTLDLKPGTYTYRCNIPGHDLLGMKGMLTVK